MTNKLHFKKLKVNTTRTSIGAKYIPAQSCRTTCKKEIKLHSSFAENYCQKR